MEKLVALLEEIVDVGVGIVDDRVAEVVMRSGGSDLMIGRVCICCCCCCDEAAEEEGL